MQEAPSLAGLAPEKYGHANPLAQETDVKDLEVITNFQAPPFFGLQIKSHLTM